MKRLLLAGVVALVLAGCGGSDTATETTAVGSAESAATTSAEASSTDAAGCSASGLDAMTVLSNFELEMGEAQKAGKLTVDQLTAARTKLFDQTQAAAANNDWVGYCKAIDDMRAELGL